LPNWNALLNELITKELFCSQDSSSNKKFALLVFQVMKLTYFLTALIVGI